MKNWKIKILDVPLPIIPWSKFPFFGFRESKQRAEKVTFVCLNSNIVYFGNF
jgi:hypothetical protein